MCEDEQAQVEQPRNRQLQLREQEATIPTNQSPSESEPSDSDLDACDDSDDAFDADREPLNSVEKMEEFCDTWIRSLNWEQKCI